MKHPTPNQKIKRLFLAIAGTLCLLPSAHAAVMLTDYQFTDASGNSAISPSNATASAASVGNSGVSFPGSGRNVAWTLTSVTGTTENLSYANNFYVEFTLTPNAGFSASLTSLTFNIGGSTGTASAFTANFFVRSNLVGTNFDTDVGSLASFVAPVSSPTSATQPVTITLSLLPAFQNITSAVTFRVYSYGDAYNPGFTNGDHPRLDDLILNGDIMPAVVPEPGSLALAAVGLTGLVIFRRRVRLS